MEPKESRPPVSAKYHLDLEGRILQADTLTDLLVDLLNRLNRTDPGTLERLSHLSRRKRRIVARRRLDLFPGRPDLTDFARPLNGGWWLGTNNSKKDVQAILGFVTHAANIKGPALCLRTQADPDDCDLATLLKRLLG